jgi:hypothetical protein
MIYLVITSSLRTKGQGCTVLLECLPYTYNDECSTYLHIRSPIFPYRLGNMEGCEHHIQEFGESTTGEDEDLADSPRCIDWAY